jgi:hypothetical protein
MAVIPSLVALGVLYAYPPDQFAFYPKCLLFSTTGWQCPGCGGLRATHALLHGQFAAAWALNPMPLAGGVLAAIYAAGTWIQGRRGRRWGLLLTHPLWIWGFTIWLMMFALTRNLPWP